MIGSDIKLKQALDGQAPEDIYYEAISEPYVTSTTYKKAVTFVVVASLLTGRVDEIMINQIDKILSTTDKSDRHIDLSVPQPPPIPIKRRIRERQSSKNNKY